MFVSTWWVLHLMYLLVYAGKYLMLYCKDITELLAILCATGNSWDLNKRLKSQYWFSWVVSHDDLSLLTDSLAAITSKLRGKKFSVTCYCHTICLSLHRYKSFRVKHSVNLVGKPRALMMQPSSAVYSLQDNINHWLSYHSLSSAQFELNLSVLVVWNWA